MPVLITTNEPFSEWADVFSSAACVVTLVDRLIHRSEIVQLDGESYRLREAVVRTLSGDPRAREGPQRWWSLIEGYRFGYPHKRPSAPALRCGPNPGPQRRLG